MMPLAFNVTIINSDSVFSNVTNITYSISEIQEEEEEETDQGRRNLADKKMLERCV